MIESQTTHNLSVGILTRQEIKNEKQVGTGFNVPCQEKPYFILNLWNYPGQNYYVVRNRDNARYTIFSKMSPGVEDIPVFQCPVGYGYITTEHKELLQLQFNFPWQKCFLSLHPDNRKEVQYGKSA